MENQFYKPSTVILRAKHQAGKTILEDAYYSSPYKIMRPFYNHDDYMTIICMCSSSGIMAGDQQDFQFYVGENAKLEFVSQSYERIHKMKEGFATRTTKANVGKNALFYYNPLPTQPFKNSAFESKVDIHLEDDSAQFIMKEILTAGRVSRGEKFEYKFYHNLVNIYTGNTLDYRDNTRFEPNMMDLFDVGMHEGYTHMGTLLLFHIQKDASWITAARKLLDDDVRVDGGITRIDQKAIVIRVLGYQSEHLEQILNQILAIPTEIS